MSSIECLAIISVLCFALAICCCFFTTLWCALDRQNRAHTEPTPAQVERASLLQLKGVDTKV